MNTSILPFKWLGFFSYPLYFSENANFSSLYFFTRSTILTIVQLKPTKNGSMKNFFNCF